MAKLFVLLSHKLTDEQKRHIQEIFEITSDNIYSLPSSLQEQWTNVPTVENLIMSTHFQAIQQWLLANAQVRDYVLVQGETGATYYMVNFCFVNHWQPIYSTSNRVVKQTTLATGELQKVSIYNHVAFRRYEQVI